MSVQIELLGGPGDGDIADVGDATLLWILSQPIMTPAEFIAMEERPDLVEYATMPVREHAYGKTDRFSKTSGARVFEYVGERVQK